VLHRREAGAPKIKDPTPDSKVRLRGLPNLPLLGGVIGAILLSAYWKPGVSFAVHGVEVELQNLTRDVLIVALVRTADRTGVEMEALTAVTVAGLTLIDMVKAVDPAAVLSDVRVESKTGGLSGDWTR